MYIPKIVLKRTLHNPRCVSMLVSLILYDTQYGEAKPVTKKP